MIEVGTYSIDGFLAVSGKTAGQRREPKICEGWRCGKMFFRPSAPTARHGETLCGVCKAKEELRKNARRLKDVKASMGTEGADRDR